MKRFTIVACLLALTAASGTPNIQRTSPPLLLVGKSEGVISKCELDKPDKCKDFHTGSGSTVKSIIVRGEYLYASYSSGDILRCEFNTEDSCTVFHKAKKYVRANCLAAVSEYLFVGNNDGTVLRCKLDQPHSCSNIHSFHPRDQVISIFEYGKYIYVATTQSLSYCQKAAETFICSPVKVDGPFWKVAHTGNIIVTYQHPNIYGTSYNLTSTNTLVRVSTILAQESLMDIAIFKRKMYSLTTIGDIKTCQADKESTFNAVARHEHAFCITALYGVHHLQNSYDSCNEESRPSTVFNYGVEHRALLEVRVAGGVLRDARGGLVDSRRADRGRAGRAAVFAMGPGGQLLLSLAHRSGLVHVSSLFAGHPVAGAGEIVVEDGVVKRIVACSVYYWPDVELNRQVVDELIRQGYERAEEISLEECAYTCDKN